MAFVFLCAFHVSKLRTVHDKIVFGQKNMDLGKVRVLGVVVSVNKQLNEIIIDDSTGCVLCQFREQLMLPKVGDVVDILGDITNQPSRRIIVYMAIEKKDFQAETTRWLEIIKLFETVYFPPYPAHFSISSTTPSYQSSKFLLEPKQRVVSVTIDEAFILSFIRSNAKPTFQALHHYFLSKNASNLNDLRDILDKMIMDCEIFQDEDIFVLA